MVLCVILAHGRYNNDLETTDVKIPYNIRLIQYTHPAIELSNPDAYYILNQLINDNKIREYGSPPFIIKPEIIDLEMNDSSYTLLSPPHIKRIGKTKFYNNDNRQINDEFQPQGKFKIYEPNSTTPNIDLEFMDEPRRISDNILLETKMVKQTRQGTIVEHYRVNTGAKSIGIWLNEVSCYYEKEFPSKIINLIQLSCRSTNKSGYNSVDELADDFARKCSIKPTLSFSKEVDYRAGVEGVKRSKRDESFWSDCEQFEFIHINPPFIIKKSRDTIIPFPSICDIKSKGGYSVSKRIKTNKRNKRNKKNKSNKRNKTNKTNKTNKKSMRKNRYRRSI